MKLKESPTFSKNYQITKRSYEQLLETTVRKCFQHISNSFGIQMDLNVQFECLQPLEVTLKQYVPNNIYGSFEFKRCISFFLQSHTQTIDMYHDYLEFGNTEVSI
jgi:hypothetical protein